MTNNKSTNNNQYSIAEALELVKKNSREKFDASIDVHIKLGIDVKKSEQQVRGVIVLPAGAGKEKKIAAFTEKQQAEAKEAGADLIGGKELVEEIKTTGKINFDLAVADPEMMKELAKIAKILGPKGLMPTPKNETVTAKIKETVLALKKGKVTFKNDDTGNIHQTIGKVSWETAKLKENFEAFTVAVRKARPAGVKGAYLKRISICSSMGKSVEVAV